MRTRLAIGLSLTSLLLACSDSSTIASAAGGDARVVSLTIAPATVVLDVHDEQPFTVTATFDDGHQEDVTAAAALASSGAAIQLSDGVAVGVEGGDANLTASFRGVTARADVHVGAFSPAVFFETPADELDAKVVAGQNGAAWFFTGTAGAEGITPFHFDPTSGAWSGGPKAPFDLVDSHLDVGGRLAGADFEVSTDTARAGFYAPGASALADVRALQSAPGQAVSPWLLISPNRQHVVALTFVWDPDHALAPQPLYATRWTAASGWSSRFQVADDADSAGAAVADDGSFLVAWTPTPAAMDAPVDVRAMFVSPSNAASKPVTLVSAAVNPWPIVATNATGSGVIAVEKGAHGHATLFDAGGGVVAPGPGFELGSTNLPRIVAQPRRAPERRRVRRAAGHRGRGGGGAGASPRARAGGRAHAREGGEGPGPRAALRRDAHGRRRTRDAPDAAGRWLRAAAFAGGDMARPAGHPRAGR